MERIGNRWGEEGEQERKGRGGKEGRKWGGEGRVKEGGMEEEGMEGKGA